MIFLARLTGLVFLIAAIWFGLSNLDGTTFRLMYVLPPEGMTLPGWAWAFALFGGGFLVGAIAALFADSAVRRDKRALKKTIKAKDRELEAQQTELAKLKGQDPQDAEPSPLAILGRV